MRPSRCLRRLLDLELARGAAVVLPLVIAGLGCGGEVHPIEEAPQHGSPWLLTLERASGRDGILRALRIQDGKPHREVLDSSVVVPMVWSFSGQWLSYVVAPPGEDAQRKMRRFDGERWSEPVLLTHPSGERAASSLEWSRTRDQLLLTERRQRSVELAVAMPRADGSVATRALDVHDVGSAYWAPSGDRIVVIETPLSGRRAKVFDVSAGPELVTTTYELAPPSGSAFDDVEPSLDGRPFRDGTVSPDGLWIVFVVTEGGDRATRALQAFSTTGVSPIRKLEGCPVAQLPGGAACTPYGWTGSSTLLVTRRTANGGKALEAWTPSTGSSVALGDVSPAGSLGSTSSAFLVRHGRSKAHSIVDLRDPGDPVSTPVPTTELPSFQRLSASPDGDWLVLTHDDQAANAGWFTAVDLRSAPPWPAREVLRGGREVARRGVLWSPGGSFAFVPDPPNDAANVERGTRIDLATGTTTTIEVTVPRRDPSNVPYSWQWQPRFGTDDRTLAIPLGDKLALWSMDRRKETAIVFDDIPATAYVRWVPTR